MSDEPRGSRVWPCLIAAVILLFTAYVAAYFAVSKLLSPASNPAGASARVFNGPKAFVFFTPLRRIESAVTSHKTGHANVPMGVWLRAD
jgi:hypothetical protein